MREFPLSLLAAAVMVIWIIIEVLTKVRGPTKTKFKLNPKTGKLDAQSHGKAPFDEIEPQGSILADNLNIPAILHYARPSGSIDVKHTEIVRIYGFKDENGVEIATVMGAPSQPGRPLVTHHFYRIRSMEDPASGNLMVNDIEKARWLAEKGRIL